jgi:hypothetical protein
MHSKYGSKNAANRHPVYREPVSSEQVKQVPGAWISDVRNSPLSTLKTDYSLHPFRTHTRSSELDEMTSVRYLFGAYPTMIESTEANLLNGHWR